MTDVPCGHTSLLPVRTVPALRAEASTRHSNTHVAVVGASGFIGRALLEELAAWKIPATAVVRNVATAGLPVNRIAHAKLNDALGLRRALAGADVVIQAASYVGPDLLQCEETNRLGTEAVVAAATQLGIQKIVYVSTIGVYGLGPHSGPTEQELQPEPVTYASASRLAAETYVSKHGGAIVRPGFVYGDHRRSFLSDLARISRTLDCWVDGGSARSSVISVADLATLVVALALQTPFPAYETLHACHPDPVTIYELMNLLARNGTASLPTRSLRYAEAARFAVAQSIPERYVDLVGHDHWYDASRSWSIAGLTPIRREGLHPV